MVDSHRPLRQVRPMILHISTNTYETVIPDPVPTRRPGQFIIAELSFTKVTEHRILIVRPGIGAADGWVWWSSAPVWHRIDADFEFEMLI